MPTAEDKDDMIGCSGATRVKWERLEYLLRVHTQMCRPMMERHDWVDSAYSYFDFYAGPGLYRKEDHCDLVGEYGSPIRALRILKEVFDDRPGRAANGEPLRVRAFLHDRNEGYRLQRSIKELGLSAIVDNKDCVQAMDWLTHDWISITGCCPSLPLGLAFFDPNGYPPWTAIRHFAGTKRFKCIDLLINVNSTVGKRLRLSSIHDETMTPTQHLAELGKTHIYLWEPSPGDIHQFALAYCTNGPFPEFGRLGFHRMNDPKGQRIARRIDFKPVEREKLGELPGYLRGMEDI